MATVSMLKKICDLRERDSTSPGTRGFSPLVCKKLIDPRHFCSQCHCLLRAPVQAECGDLFCDACASASPHLSKARPTCPVCGKPVSQLFRDLAIAKEMQQLPVKCENQRLSCSWEGVLKELDQHLERCEHTTYDCPNKGCGKTLSMVEMKRHTREQCVFRAVSCDHCNQQVQFRHLEEHVRNVCTQKPLTCIQCQQPGIHKDKMEKHLAGECCRQMISCRLNSYGCKEKFLREDLDKHDRDFERQHHSYMPAVSERLGQRVSGAEQQNVMENERVAATVLTDMVSVKKTADANSSVLTVQDVHLSDIGLRLDIVDVKTTTGVLVWKIGDIARRRREAQTGKTPSLYSAPFYTSLHGYKMCARIYLDGDGMGKGGCISVFFVLMRGEYDALLSWPFQLRVTMMLLDQSDTPLKRNITEVFKPDSRSASFKRPSAEMNTGSGCPMFSSVNVLESPTYGKDNIFFVKDDVIFVKIIVDQATGNPMHTASPGVCVVRH